MIKISRSAQNYLKDCWGIDKVEDIDTQTATSILENAEIDETFVDDREIMKVYFEFHNMSPCNSDQFRARRHKLEPVAA